MPIFSFAAPDRPLVQNPPGLFYYYGRLAEQTQVEVVVSFPVARYVAFSSGQLTPGTTFHLQLQTGRAKQSIDIKNGRQR